MSDFVSDGGTSLVEWTASLFLKTLKFKGYAPQIAAEGVMISAIAGEFPPSVTYMSDNISGKIFFAENENYFTAPNGSDRLPWSSIRFFSYKQPVPETNEIRTTRMWKLSSELFRNSIDFERPEVGIKMSLKNVSGDATVNQHLSPTSFTSVVLQRAFRLTGPATYANTGESALGWPVAPGAGLQLTHLPRRTGLKLHPPFHTSVTTNLGALTYSIPVMNPGDEVTVFAYYRLI